MALETSETSAFQEFLLSSGNILSKSIAWKKGNEDQDDEIFESLRSCLGSMKELPPKDGNVHELVGEDVKNNNQDVDRQELKISLKLFLYTLNDEDLRTSVRKGLDSTGAEYADTLVVTFSGRSESSPISLEELQSTWKILEEMVTSNKAKVIGLSDIDTQLFIQLHQWAAIKPGVIQINLASCCVVPPELSEFCKLHAIQLLTHSDPINAMSDEKLQMLRDAFPTKDGDGDLSAAAHLRLKWVLRYQVHLKCRGVVATKGYCAALIVNN